jgi:hypothetical protein
MPLDWLTYDAPRPNVNWAQILKDNMAFSGLMLSMSFIATLIVVSCTTDLHE